MTHRWSGWPGAWCLDCGIEDQNEICVAEHNAGLLCIKGHMMCDEHELARCVIHVNPPCPCPGEGHCDPYMRNEKRRELLALFSARRITLSAHCRSRNVPWQYFILSERLDPHCEDPDCDVCE